MCVKIYSSPSFLPSFLPFFLLFFPPTSQVAGRVAQRTFWQVSQPPAAERTEDIGIPLVSKSLRHVDEGWWGNKFIHCGIAIHVTYSLNSSQVKTHGVPNFQAREAQKKIIATRAFDSSMPLLLILGVRSSGELSEGSTETMIGLHKAINSWYIS